MLTAEKLLSLVDALGAIVWEADPETFAFSFVSAGAERILGFPPGAWLDDPQFWRRHIHADDVERCTAFYVDATRNARDHQCEYRMIAADGRVVWLRDVVSVRTREDGATRLVGIAVDITAEKLDQANQRRLSRLYEALLENSSDNISLVNADGTTVYQSSAVERQLGYTPAELVGRSNFHLLHPDDRDIVMQGFAGTLQTDHPLGPLRVRVRNTKGEWCVVETTAHRYVAEDGAVFVVTNTRDVTEVVNTEKALHAAQEQLVHALKMEAVGRLAGGVAHDFNNLLAVISGYAELVSATIGEGEARSDVEEIKRAAHRAGLLTRQLLAFSRKQVLRPERLDLNTVVRDMATPVRRLTGDHVDVALETAPVPLPVLGDRTQLEQVLVSLAVNARDAMPLGGRLVVRTAASDRSGFLIVSDTGTGMPQHVLDRAFEPFFTTKDVGKGTGLGLSTAYGIVKQSGGDIQVRSIVGKGTVFTISLPLARESGPGTPGPEMAEAMPQGSETVLLVAREGEVRDLAEQVLLHLGYDVLTAADGAAALDVCRRYRGRLALLVTEVVMEQFSGPQMYARVAELVPGLAVLYLSDHVAETVGACGVERGVGFLKKPFTPVALAQQVRAVLDGASTGGAL